MTTSKTQVHPVEVIPVAVQTSTTKEPVVVTAPSLAIHGKYSIERLLALEEYSRTKSYWHVIWVLIRVPLVPLVITILFQLPRLAPPQDGLQANSVYVVERSAVGTAIACECSLILSRALMPELIPVLTRRMGILFDLFGGAVYAALIVAFSFVWGFPVPFTPSLINSIALLSNNVIFNVVVRPIVSQSIDLQRRVKLGSMFFGVFSVAGIAYPAYIALFFAVGERSSHYQPLITPVAPLMTLVLRKLIAHATNEWEDLIPAQVVFSIEFFSYLYQTILLQAIEQLRAHDCCYHRSRLR